MALSDRVTVRDEYTAGKIFEALLKTGIGMSFARNSRPASGSEHIISHLLECKELQQGKLPNLHGEDVGVCTLEMLKYYRYLAEHESIQTDSESVDWEDIFAFYGNMAEDVKKLNFPDNVIDKVDKDVLKDRWSEIRAIIQSIPNYETCRTAMERAHCKLTVADIGKDQALFDACVKYSPYMRHRLTLLRLKDMIKI